MTCSEAPQALRASVSTESLISLYNAIHLHFNVQRHLMTRSGSSPPKDPSPGEPRDSAFFNRLRRGLKRTRDGLGSAIDKTLGKRRKLDIATIEELEEILLRADVGMPATTALLQKVEERYRKADSSGLDLTQCIKEEMIAILEPCERPWAPQVAEPPGLILMVGVNGAGKTTTIGKLAHRLHSSDTSVLLAAGDTFRAAAIDQLREWAERCQVPLVAQNPGADAAAVIYDAVCSARARKIQWVLADTAGRLHTQVDLMGELGKIRKVVKRIDPSMPHEVLLVLDAGIGQNAIAQVRQFNETIGLTGLILSKLDGTAKGGVIFALAQEMRLPIYFIGVGEQMEDLQPFNASDFIDAMFTLGAPEKNDPA